MRTVSIIQRRLTHYRVPLFDQMRLQLQDMGIRLRLLHGTGTDEEQRKRDSASLDWAEVLPTRYLLDGRVCWQPFMSRVRDSDLVVVTQENKLVNNLPLLYLPKHRRRVAFWGHGRNMQSTNPNGLLERFKRHQVKRVDWWFAYTQISADLVTEAGFDPGRVTVLNNSIDTRTLQSQVVAARAKGQPALRSRWGLGAGPVGIYLGSLYADKRLEFLFDASARIRQRIPTFELLLVGDGPQRNWVQEQAARFPSWVRYVGPLANEAKAEALAAANLMLNPGLVGLGILDAFVAGLPILTTDCGLHSPEIAYLKHDGNGLMCSNDPQRFAEDTVMLLSNPSRLSDMAAISARSAEDFSVQAMCKRFADGIHDCLQSHPGGIK